MEANRDRVSGLAIPEMKIAIVNPLPGRRTTTTKDKASRAVRRGKADWANEHHTAVVFFYGEARDRRNFVHGYRPKPCDYVDGILNPLWMRSFITYPHREPLTCQ